MSSLKQTKGNCRHIAGSRFDADLRFFLIKSVFIVLNHFFCLFRALPLWLRMVPW